VGFLTTAQMPFLYIKQQSGKREITVSMPNSLWLPDRYSWYLWLFGNSVASSWTAKLICNLTQVSGSNVQ
jgi:hypothetical protein